MGSIGGRGRRAAVGIEFDERQLRQATDAMLADPDGITALTTVGTDENPIVSYQQTVWSVIDA